jgi:hypothetical protein
MRSTVHRRRKMHPVPVHRGRFGQSVMNSDDNVFALVRDQCGPQIVAVEAPRGGSGSGDKFARTLLSGEIEDPVAVGINGGLGKRRNRERIGETDGVHRGDDAPARIRITRTQREHYRNGRGHRNRVAKPDRNSSYCHGSRLLLGVWEVSQAIVSEAPREQGGSNGHRA